ncbi:hypothetical protein MJO29_012130 [Puccinia striiformis f. sp. tritici]|uniref:hypothetical protein n=1 Tax=Puccinia striiformis f. sp. tritici TaxID=168172 RepID=UPI0020072957|nr:hypothetical protein Pst134EA_022821 [Puccinia striiformis f. sp. tritici]KAH9455352.1 hypothetical protein Pst134EA_022821 [Puccinia striiformis f. sp. tritici]KAI7945742.1 hypothetical protein MJO29_012130 [Puccinia striiformis f. sp. tritici]
MATIDKSTAGLYGCSQRPSTRIGRSNIPLPIQTSRALYDELTVNLPGSSSLHPASDSRVLQKSKDQPPFTANSISFPSHLLPRTSLSSRASTVSSTSSFIRALRSFNPPPIPTVRPPSSSKVIRSTPKSQPDRQIVSSSPETRRCLLMQPTAPRPISTTNSIQFPASSPPASPTWAKSTAANAENGCDPRETFDRLIKHWLTSKFEADLSYPNTASPNQSLVPELDILVGFKSITDKLSLPQLSRREVWATLRHVFPSAKSWAVPSLPGLRSNQELVVLGIKPKRAHHKTLKHPQARVTSDASSKFELLDFTRPIPSGSHSTELIEYMRRKICESNQPTSPARVKHSPIPFHKKRMATHVIEDTSIDQKMKKKHPCDPLRLFRFDDRRQSGNPDKSDKDLVYLLGTRIWTSLIQACKRTKDDFQAGEILVASWMERMNKYEFDVICNNSKSSNTRTTETASKKIIKISCPFQNFKKQKIKLFKYQPIESFNSIVFDVGRRHADNLAQYDRVQAAGASNASKSILKDFNIVQISTHPVVNRAQKQVKQRLDTRTKPTFFKKKNAYQSDKQQAEKITNGRQDEEQRGKSLELYPTSVNSNGASGIARSEQDKKSAIVGNLFEQINQSFRNKRKSLSIDRLSINRHQQQQQKLYNSHRQYHPPIHQDSFGCIRAYNCASSDASVSHSTLTLLEISIEFNLLYLNQLKFQIKLLQEEAI